MPVLQNRSAPRSRTVLLVLAGLVSIVVAGCNRGPTLYPVSGKVLYKDGSVPKGYGGISFVPTDNSTATIRKTASGVIGPDGSFELMTRKPGDGAFAGEYRVTIAIMKGAMDPTLLSDVKYQMPQTTPFPPILVDRALSDLKFEIEPLSSPAKN